MVHDWWGKKTVEFVQMQSQCSSYWFPTAALKSDAESSPCSIAKTPLSRTQSSVIAGECTAWSVGTRCPASNTAVLLKLPHFCTYPASTPFTFHAFLSAIKYFPNPSHSIVLTQASAETTPSLKSKCPWYNNTLLKHSASHLHSVLSPPCRYNLQKL